MKKMKKMKKITPCILAVSCFLLSGLLGGCAGNNTSAGLPPSETVQSAEPADVPETNDSSSNAADPVVPADSVDATVTSGSAADPAMAPQPAATDAFIGEEAAKAAALEHAGLSEADLTFVRAHLDHDDGRTVYDIEFYQSNTEYDYEVDAVTGAILSYDFDIENYAVQPAQQGGNPVPAQGEISLDEAKSIALASVNLTADQVVFNETSFEYDDGIAVYQIAFWSGNMEYEFDINAADGTILEYDAEH